MTSQQNTLLLRLFLCVVFISAAFAAPTPTPTPAATVRRYIYVNLPDTTMATFNGTAFTQDALKPTGNGSSVGIARLNDAEAKGGVPTLDVVFYFHDAAHTDVFMSQYARLYPKLVMTSPPSLVESVLPGTETPPPKANTTSNSTGSGDEDSMSAEDRTVCIILGVVACVILTVFTVRFGMILLKEW
eukprot:PhM_4_TR17649/c0_g1_i1/m.85487